MNNLSVTDKQIGKASRLLYSGISQLIESARRKAAVFLNTETTLLYWSIGSFINANLKQDNRTAYGTKIIATLSQQLTANHGRGFTYTSLTRMCKVAEAFNKKNIATLSQQLSWSHLIELALIEDPLKRDFYVQMSTMEKWSVRNLREKIDKMLFERTAIAKHPKNIIRQSIQQLKDSNHISPELIFKNTYILDFLNLPADYSENDLENALIMHIEKFILELGSGFAFIERQKRITVDATDYHLDLLFYHRKLKRLIAIDLKLGKFKPEYKSQMELYLRWLEKYDMQCDEQAPVGLLLCSEGNTEHIELLMLNHQEIKVAQYLTELPSKKWFADKLHRALAIAKQNLNK
ncbi:MAG: DUF1016 family protein [Chitinophagaceae bacterium]|nr:DUF1016 family protein [Chitinophagaceae bacterium]